MEQCKKVAYSDESLFVLHPVKKMPYGKKASWQRMCDALGPGLHVHVSLTHTTTFLNIVADQVHLFTEAVFPDGSELF